MVQFVAVILAAIGLTAGVFVGLSQIYTQVTTVVPPNTQVRASCGIYYAPGVPALRNTDPVPLPTNSKVLVPRAPYTEKCARATSWQPYVAWAITGLGLLGFTVIWVVRRHRLAEEAKKKPRSSGGPSRSSPLWN